MNGINSLGGGAREANAASDPASSEFDAVFNEQIGNVAAVMFQFLGSDIIESVMKSETSVD